MKQEDLENLSEPELKNIMSNYFSQWFDVIREVSNYERESRIDLVMIHRKHSWFRVGVEVKTHKTRRGVDLGNHCNQAKRYALTTFVADKVEMPRFPILIYPAISDVNLEYKDPHRDNFRHDPIIDMHNVNSFLYTSFGIGEIRWMPQGDRMNLKFMFNNSCLWRMWSTYRREESGFFPHEKNYYKILRLLDKDFPIYA